MAYLLSFSPRYCNFKLFLLFNNFKFSSVNICWNRLGRFTLHSSNSATMHSPYFPFVVNSFLIGYVLVVESSVSFLNGVHSFFSNFPILLSSAISSSNLLLLLLLLLLFSILIILVVTVKK